MLHALLMVFGAILLVSFLLYLATMVLLVVCYFIFCGPYLWWFNLHQPPDKRKFSLIRDYRNAFRYYKSRFTGTPPVFL